MSEPDAFSGDVPISHAASGDVSTDMFAPIVPVESRPRPLQLDSDKIASFIAGARDKSPVSGLTHAHYKYPARFSPILVSAAVEAFTRPGDLVLDPFVGGGTTAVECMARGRDVVGTDISSLAIFISEAKTVRLDETDRSSFANWLATACNGINMHAPKVEHGAWEAAGYARNIDTREFWRLRKAIGQLLGRLNDLSPAAEMLARCAILRSGHWAFDACKFPPDLDTFKRHLVEGAATIFSNTIAFGEKVGAASSIYGQSPKAKLIQRSAIGLEVEPCFAEMAAPKLVLTSPPYPGVHVLYHRWQVDGRKETPAPFWIANRLDGSGESYYTLGHRRHPGLRTYFSNLQASLTSVARVASVDTMFIQVVAFNDPTWQLPGYLAAAAASGLEERILPGLDSPDGRLWRRVPGRRWYADQRGPTAAAHEVVLFFKKTR